MFISLFKSGAKIGLASLLHEGGKIALCSIFDGREKSLSSHKNGGAKLILP